MDAWLGQSAQRLSPELLLQLLEVAFGAVWARTSTTLGEVTLTAIAERVLYNASEKFPFLLSLEVDPSTGLQCSELREGIDSVTSPELVAGIRFILVELLSVLGNLTAEILTPDLHSELSHVALPVSGRGGEGS